MKQLFTSTLLLLGRRRMPSPRGVLVLGISSWVIDSQTPGRPPGGSLPSMLRGCTGNLGQGHLLPWLPHSRAHMGRGGPGQWGRGQRTAVTDPLDRRGSCSGVSQPCLCLTRGSLHLCAVRLCPQQSTTEPYYHPGGSQASPGLGIWCQRDLESGGPAKPNPWGQGWAES